MFQMKRLLRCILVLTILICSIMISTRSVHAASIYSYPLPSIYMQSTTYSLKAGGTSIPVVSYTGEYDYAGFSMSGGSTTIEITATGATSITSYGISPKKLNLTGIVSGNKLTFTISKDEYLIVQINSLKRLVITADPGETDKPASSGTGIFNVKISPYNADSTGNTLATTAIQSAIDEASSYNGGIVYVPAGVYKIGNLQLKSNMKLYLEGGAVLRSSTVKTDYTMHWHKDSINKDVTWWLYTQTGATNIKIYGRGTIDGNATALSGFANNLLVPMACSYLTVDGITFRDSASWAVTPARSNDLAFSNIKFLNRFNVGEDDGIDVCESQNVTVTNAIGMGLDDPFTTKAWAQTTDISRNWPGSPETINNVVFDDCIAWTYCYGFKVGQGVLQNQSNVTFKNGVVYDCSVGIGIHHRYGTATASSITFDNIDIEKISNTNDSSRTWMKFKIESGPNGDGPITNVTVKNIKIRDKGTTTAILRGYSSSSSISGVTFNNVYMPGSSTSATTMYEMNILDKAYYSGITILPVQNPEPVERTNLALGKTVAASSSSNPTNNPPSLVVDGNQSTRWSSTYTDPSWIYIDLGTATSINGVRLYWEVAYGKSYQIQVSNNASTWTTVNSTTTGDGGVDDISFATTSARYLRMYGTQRGTQWGYSLWEFEVYGPITSAVTFYQDANYGGTIRTLAKGNYTMTQLNAAGIPNDWMSSLRVPSGWTVDVYQNDNFTGIMWTFTSDTSYVGSACNDQMTSVRIY